MTPTALVLVSVELALVVAIGIIAARSALRRQEIRHAAMVLEYLPAPALPPPGVEPLRIAPPVVQQERFDSAAGARWVIAAKAVADRIVDERGEVTADDVWNEFPPPAVVDGRLMASVFAGSDWQITRYRSSVRGRNAARQIAVWQRKRGVRVA